MLDALVDGQRQQLVSLADRGLHFGDGLFETIAIVNGQLVFWDEHMQRLLRGCEHLLLPLPDLPQMFAEATSLASSQARAVLKIIYTAGDNERGYSRPEPLVPRRILIRQAAPAHPASYWRDGVAIGYCAQRLGDAGALTGLKHLNRLEQVLARRELDGRRLVEGLMLDQSGHVIEGVASNLFAVFGDLVVTPPIATAGVRGIMRDHVLGLADSIGYRAEEQPLTPLMLDEADELFLTNSLIGLWPVARLEGCCYQPGAVSQALLQQLIATASCLAPVLENHA